MKRASGLIDISRREFCAFACGAALVGCVDGDTGAIQTGGLNGSDGTLAPDAGVNVVVDAGTSGATCSGTYVDVGLASAFIATTPKLFTGTVPFYVVRDSSGLYALTSKCSHKHVQLNIQGSQFHCPSHGADFTFNGAVIDGPTSTALVHYAMCTLASGHVGVQTGALVSASTRLIA